MFEKFINTIFCISSLLSISYCQLWLPMVQKPEEAKDSKLYVLDVIGLVEKLGYRAEQHNVTTEDGYMLDLFRISPNNSLQKRLQRGPPIYMQHGLFGSAEEMILAGDRDNLVYVLSDAGYDIWLGNLRGNYHGRKHKAWSPNESRFWDFSLDEWALKDTPVMLDYVLKTTGCLKLTYVGISLSSTLNIMLLSHRTEFNEKINLSVLFSPIVFWKKPHSNFARKLLFAMSRGVQGLETDGAFEVFKPNPFFYVFISNTCGSHISNLRLCLHFNRLMWGDNRDQWDNMELAEINRIGLYLPAGLSGKALLHYAQHLRTEELQFYDHKNDEINLRYYGQKQVPYYNVSNIVSPLVIFRGTNDVLVLPKDVETFVQKLPRTTTVIYEEVKNFTHVDFIMAKDAKKMVHDKLLRTLTKFVQFS